MPKLTFLDSGVLLWAVRGKPEHALKAFEVLDDPERVIASSPYVKLETLPKPIYFKLSDQQASLEAIFSSVKVWTEPGQKIIDTAFEIASKDGLGAIDALQIASAVSTGAEEFVT